MKIQKKKNLRFIPEVVIEIPLASRTVQVGMDELSLQSLQDVLSPDKGLRQVVLQSKRCVRVPSHVKVKRSVKARRPTMTFIETNPSSARSFFDRWQKEAMCAKDGLKPGQFIPTVTRDVATIEIPVVYDITNPRIDELVRRMEVRIRRSAESIDLNLEPDITFDYLDILSKNKE